MASSISAMISGSVVAVALDRAGERVAAERAEAHRAHLGRLAGPSGMRSSSTMIRLPSRSTTGRSAREVQRHDRDVLAGGCSARRRARSSWRAGTRGWSRPCACGCCRGSTARAAGCADPSDGCAERKEKTRSLARLFSSSRRAPPKAASKPCVSSACFSASVFITSVWIVEPWVNGLMPCARDLRGSCSTMQLHADRLRGRVAELDHVAELPRRIDVQQRERRRRRDRTPCGPGAASPSCPCRSSTASPAARHSAATSRMMWMLSAFEAPKVRERRRGDRGRIAGG